jgi:monoamine oxidase
MDRTRSQHYDVAIVGGGVAGCYCAYRLSAMFPDRRIGLFESASRLGGRLDSRFVSGVDTAVELGGAFVTDLHETTLALLQRLGLPLTPVRWSRRFSFMRGRRVTDRSYRCEPETNPYAFAPAERGRSPADILRGALQTIVPEVASLWPLDRGASREAARYMQQVRFDGRLLDDWDIEDMLREVVSGEAYASFLAGFGSGANFRNASAYDAIRTLMGEMAPQAPFIVAGGFQQLPMELARRSRAEVHTAARLQAIANDGGGVLLGFESGGTIGADKIILALPPHALAAIELGAAAREAFGAMISRVSPVSAFKLFLSFERPWWRALNASPKLGIAVSYTDQPMQQCYYYDHCGEGPALLLAAFADDASASFWRALPEGEEGMIDAALAQLRAMHPQADIAAPIEALARFWPAAWHSWKPGARSWNTAREALGPHLGLPVFVCGEAWSEHQGWVEGALTSAESLLREFFLP